MDTNMEMVPYQRQLADVTRDIRRQAGQLVAAGIEIGRLLFEAKELVPRGHWGEYIKTQLPFSHSWANNYMRLYKEYGQAQADLFAPDDAKVAGLTVSKALALLELPEEARQGFLEQNDVEAMSTRELENAIRERDAAEDRVSELEEDLNAASTRLEEAFVTIAEAERMAAAQKSRAEAAEAQARRKETELEKLNRKYTDAKNAEAAAKRQVDRLKERPEIPESAMAAMRKQVEANEKAKAKAEVGALLTKAEADLAAARREVEEARQAEDRANAMLQELQGAARMADGDAAVFKLCFESVQETFNRMLSALIKVDARDPDTGEKFKIAVRAVLAQWKEAI